MICPAFLLRFRGRKSSPKKIKKNVNVQAEKLEAAQSNLIHISISVNKALQQLDELIKQQHIDDGSKE